MKTLITWFMAFALTAQAAEIIKYTEGDINYLAIAADAPSKVEMNQNLCVYLKKKQIACGLVIRTSEKGYILALDASEKKMKFTSGTKVEIRKMARSTAAQTSHLDIVQTPYETDRTYKGLVAGLATLSPYVRFEQMLLDWLNLGVMPTYLLNQSSGQGSLSGGGVYAVTSIYPLEPLNKLWGMGGIGGFFATAKKDAASDKALVLGTFLSGGWRFRFGEMGSAGIAGGAQFFLLPGTNAMNGIVGGLSPFIAIDAGLIF